MESSELRKFVGPFTAAYLISNFSLTKAWLIFSSHTFAQKIAKIIEYL